ncbi:MAG TPA: hypothetical protein VMW63_06440 [Methanoregulaceae archaeon]|nr:hypothetical protein [Methanoregulaceae archaeon]
MAAASLVATALGIVLLIVAAYILVGGVLVTSETVVETQKDMTAVQVKMLGTSLEITDVSTTNPLNITVTNSGNEPIRNFEDIDVYLMSSSVSPVLYQYGTEWTKVINNDVVYPNQWDPGEEITIFLTYTGSPPSMVQITTGNGISARYIV